MAQALARWAQTAHARKRHSWKTHGKMAVCYSFHAKQLVQHAIMKASEVPILANEIQVQPTI
jgi:hypothetical protein